MRFFPFSSHKAIFNRFINEIVDGFHKFLIEKKIRFLALLIELLFLFTMVFVWCYLYLAWMQFRYHKIHNGFHLWNIAQFAEVYVQLLFSSFFHR